MINTYKEKNSGGGWLFSPSFVLDLEIHTSVCYFVQSTQVGGSSKGARQSELLLF